MAMRGRRTTEWSPGRSAAAAAEEEVEGAVWTVTHRPPTEEVPSATQARPGPHCRTPTSASETRSPWATETSHSVPSDDGDLRARRDRGARARAPGGTTPSAPSTSSTDSRAAPSSAETRPHALVAVAMMAEGRAMRMIWAVRGDGLGEMCIC